jgi:hypothetical protein
MNVDSVAPFVRMRAAALTNLFGKLVAVSTSDGRLLARREESP